MVLNFMNVIAKTSLWLLLGVVGCTTQVKKTPVTIRTVSPTNTARLTETVSPEPSASETLIAIPEVTEWQEVELPRKKADMELNLGEIHMLDEANGWAVAYRENNDEMYDLFQDEMIPIEMTAQDHILITPDGGKTWQDVSPPELVWVKNEAGKAYYLEFSEVTVFFLDSTNAWAAYSSSNSYGDQVSAPTGLWRTQDGGLSWDYAELPKPEYASMSGIGCSSNIVFS